MKEIIQKYTIIKRKRQPNNPKDGLKEKGHFFLLSNFFSLLLILKEEHVSDQTMV